jgi:hypothetical protein
MYAAFYLNAKGDVSVFYTMIAQIAKAAYVGQYRTRTCEHLAKLCLLSQPSIRHLARNVMPR